MKPQKSQKAPKAAQQPGNDDNFGHLFDDIYRWPEFRCFDMVIVPDPPSRRCRVGTRNNNWRDLDDPSMREPSPTTATGSPSSSLPSSPSYPLIVVWALPRTD